MVGCLFEDVLRSGVRGLTAVNTIVYSCPQHGPAWTSKSVSLNVGRVILTCPKCRTEISTEDVNVSTDIALCRRCGETFSFAELSLDRVVADVDTSRPPGGTWYRAQGNEFEVGAVSRSGSAFFLVPFTLFWSGGSLGGIYGTQLAKGQFDLMQSLFGLPFLIGSLVLIPITLMTLFGRVVVRSSGDQGGVFIGVGPLGWTRRFRWSQIKGVRASETQWKQNDRALPVIELDGPTRLRFGSQLSEKRRDFMLAVLRRRVPGR